MKIIIKLIKAIALTLFIANIPVNAVFYNAMCLSKELPKNKKQHVQFLADIHMVNTDMSDQVEAVLQEVEKNPENSCVIVELNESCATPEVEAAAKTSQAGLFCNVGNACKNKNIETVFVDFRAYLDPETNEVLTFPHTPEKIPAQTFMAILEEEIEDCKDYLTKEQISFWEQLQELYSHEDLEEMTLQDLFEYNNIEASAPSQSDIIQFCCQLMNTKIIKTIKESNKENIFVVAGGAHTNNVSKTLKTDGYAICCDHGLSMDKAIDVFMEHKNNPTELAANMPQVDMQKYFSDMQTHHGHEKDGKNIYSPTIVT